MEGDPRANEFWYQYDQYLFFDQPPEVKQIYAEIVAVVGPVNTWRTLWLQHRQGGDYPGSWAALWAPARKQLAALSAIQLDFFHAYYRCRIHRIVPAFSAMAQGLLYDPRRPVGAKLHVMDPPQGGTEAYHRWHAINRANVLLGVDAAWWSAVDPVVGFAWAVQSIAQPVKDSPDNPGLPANLERRLRRSWLHRDAERLDQAFESFPYPADLPEA